MIIPVDTLALIMYGLKYIDRWLIGDKTASSRQ